MRRLRGWGYRDDEAQMESVRAARGRTRGGGTDAELVRMWPSHGISNVELPGGPGAGSDRMTIYVQMPDTFAVNVNSRVRWPMCSSAGSARSS